MNRILLTVAALASASFTSLAANQWPTCDTTRLGGFADEMRDASKPTDAGGWVVVLDDAANMVFPARTRK